MPIFIPGPAGRLEALFKSPSSSPPMAAVLCHPHPQFGGTMHDKVVFTAGKALERLGLATLRFNYRGVGKSEGVYDEGRGEEEDVRAALDFLSQKYPGLPLCLVGFSFGARVGLPVGCGDPRVALLIGLGTPVTLADFGFLAVCNKPKLLIHGREDELIPAGAVEAFAAGAAEPMKLVVIEGADHFFTGKLKELERVMVEYFKERGLSIGPQPFAR